MFIKTVTIAWSFVLTSALAPAWAQSAPPAGQQRVDIVQIYERFFASRIAALDCHATSEATELPFLTNMQIVQIRALMAIKERNAGVPEEQLATRVVDFEKHAKEAIDNEVSHNGCNAPRIQQLVSLYKLHASMKLQ